MIQIVDLTATTISFTNTDDPCEYDPGYVWEIPWEIAHRVPNLNDAVASELNARLARAYHCDETATE